MPGNYSKLVTVITGQSITAAERNNEFDNVINNMTPDGVDDASANTAAMQATTDPSGATLATSLRGEVKGIRFQLLKLNVAAGNWYDSMAWLSAITPATPGSTATDLNNRLAQIVKHLQTLNVASGNWYDAMSFLAGITPAAAGATGTDLANRLSQIVSQIKNLGGLTNWYDAVTAALLKAGGTMAGDIAMGSHKVTGLAAATASGEATRYEQINGFRVLSVNTVSTTAVTNNSTTSYVDTGLTKAITPVSSASKFFIFATVGAHKNTANYMIITIARDGTDLSPGAAGFALRGFVSGAGSFDFNSPVQFFDSPATGSSITYTVRIRSSDANQAAFNADGAALQMTIFEIG